ncbi:DUF3551 domain-containing protein [Bradyrhizobium iriomotense]|uniref:DUF3551 domain-containing protein n=1 Tax=Bradyrhizobium iriomotense TaxID=441950 RepID=A0ABQ6BBQ8_9BRAD|nr:DUF3551 domain-containing protein [Bradyrhizobium iriomotense]GLR90931.1 hypothetical protein GCM10007857_76470 [Bradyrhizobium iriomotense]
MRMLHLLILAGATMLAVAPATAQRYDPRYPVCLQSWYEAGLTDINCSYVSIEQCRATVSGLYAMCLENPYWQGVPWRNSRRQGHFY